MALAGIITGAVAVVLSLVVIAVIVLAFATGNAASTEHPDPRLTQSAPCASRRRRRTR